MILLKVLLVDDEPSVTKGLINLIPWNEEGFSVCGIAQDGEEAIEKINTLNPDVVITDIKMPVIDGLELIKIINEKSRLDVMFIILSGFNDFEYARKAMKYNVK